MHVEMDTELVDGRFNLWPTSTARIVPDLGTDSEDYDVLRAAAEESRTADGLSLQIGLRLGGGAKIIMDALGPGRTHAAVDPYGNIVYAATDDQTVRLDYTNAMMHEALANLHLYAYQTGAHFLYFPMEDTEFMSRFAHGVPVYRDTKTLENRYALVVFDGPHATQPVLTEAAWFDDRTGPGSVFVFDDVDTYNHGLVDRVLLGRGWRVMETSAFKISYRKD